MSSDPLRLPILEALYIKEIKPKPKLQVDVLQALPSGKENNE